MGRHHPARRTIRHLATPHERPALVAAVGLARVLPGGILVERLSDLGSELDTAVVLAFLIEHSGGPGYPGPFDVEPVKRTEGHGTFTVGDLGRVTGSSRRSRPRTGNNRIEWFLRSTRWQLNQILTRLGHPVAFDERLEALEEVVRRPRDGEDSLDFIGERVTSSDLFPDLSYGAARDFALAPRHEGGANVRRVEETLQAFGFLNRKGNRLWNREHAEVAGGWRE